MNSKSVVPYWQRTPEERKAHDDAKAARYAQKAHEIAVAEVRDASMFKQNKRKK